MSLLELDSEVEGHLSEVPCTVIIISEFTAPYVAFVAFVAILITSYRLLQSG